MKKKQFKPLNSICLRFGSIHTLGFTTFFNACEEKLKTWPHYWISFITIHQQPHKPLVQQQRFFIFFTQKFIWISCWYGLAQHFLDNLWQLWNGFNFQRRGRICLRSRKIFSSIMINKELSFCQYWWNSIKLYKNDNNEKQLILIFPDTLLLKMPRRFEGL